MSGATRRVVIVGDSIAGCTAARELRALGHDGPITMVGCDPDGCYARPPLSKRVLAEGVGASDAWDLSDLDLTAVTALATGVDVERRVIRLAEGDDVPYDALIVATGAAARRLAAPDQSGELVVRSLADARLLRERLENATSAIVVGAGFLGMEVASACAARDIPVTVVDVDPPLQRILGPFLSDAIAARAAARSVDVRRVDRPVELVGDPVGGVRIDGIESTADLVVSCVGEVPGTHWLDGSGLGDAGGVDIDDRCATAVSGVFAAGDVTRGSDESGRVRRTPFWSNAIAQGRVAAASALDLPARCTATDDYFWTEVLGLSIKVVGPLPLVGAPTVLEGSVEDGSALLEWTHADGRRTVVAYGMKKAVGLLRRMVS
ncbi:MULTISPECIES: NAD(P)/FAD-dependent oxidoreductase [Nocardiaceae]|uniref:NADPH-dependent 2,4-dienoyl-CoA reductase/sulfur reductase-like enzyme n=1 Tax=Rhodococcoides corynebacterioides TaxID=53972 RepID=A0ABS2KNW6_9NOCA|nr:MULTISPECIES: FAD-dependent oxidoreductase [Rhodococcus]MBM7413436.1 NADPH-dependent 2,4-dienoyl-CoA reductase/sulfur reductase-like enzyme [Rhodococcus corynebacterioides]MBP1115899.1 NADPH-dependent 2,4-dienoyl-CoA reductase/sulfur reductase-like enzyme [Rhodococcus sp. PvP016]